MSKITCWFEIFEWGQRYMDGPRLRMSSGQDSLLTLCMGVFSPNTCVETHTRLCLRFFLSFLLHYAKFLFWRNCHFPTSRVWEPKAPWVSINETLGPIIMVVASVYITWVKDTVQLVWEKDIFDGKVGLVPLFHPYSWCNHIQGWSVYVINLRWELPPPLAFDP